MHNDTIFNYNNLILERWDENSTNQKGKMDKREKGDVKGHMP